MRAALYARVSTREGQNLEMQLAELREFCERRGVERGKPTWAVDAARVAELRAQGHSWPP